MVLAEKQLRLLPAPQGAIRAGPGKDSAVLTPGNRSCVGSVTAWCEMETDYRVRLFCRTSGGFGGRGRGGLVREVKRHKFHHVSDEGEEIDEAIQQEHERRIG